MGGLYSNNNKIQGEIMKRRTYRNLVNLSPDKVILCHLCGMPILSRKEYSKDHCPPLSRGGKKKDWKPAHKACNNIRGALTMEEYAVWQELEHRRNGR
jgi:hypothetical protein